MTKADEYREKLGTLKDWDAFLLSNSGLPGPRGNLELAQAVADIGERTLFERYVSYDPAQAPTNSPQEFLVVCGVIGLGRLVAQGKHKYLTTLRACASDPRWRTREAVAMALQRVGDEDMALLLAEMEKWSKGNLLEKRAAAAALCEPRLLQLPEQTKTVLDILDAITASIEAVQDRKSEEFRILRQGLAYCWSVAVAALPAPGKEKMGKWLSSQDPDILWVMRENLKKNRLTRVDAAWVARSKKRLGA